MALNTSIARLSALLAAGLMTTDAAHAADNRIEGVWEMETPATSFKPVGGPIPLTADGRKHYEANKKLRAQKKFDDYDITTSRCASPGVPRLALTPGRFKIWYRQNVVDMDFEWNRAIREINVGSTELPDVMGFGSTPKFTGNSQGHWEGNTLVVTTNNLSDATLIDDLVPHGFDLKVTEHIRMIDENTLENRITIEDPEYFTKPWDAVVTYKRRPQAIFPEDVCLDRIKAGQPAFPKR